MYRSKLWRIKGWPGSRVLAVNCFFKNYTFIGGITPRYQKVKLCSSTGGKSTTAKGTGKYLDKTEALQYPFSLENAKSKQTNSQSSGQDLRRFFDEVGINPAETKYWYRQFQRTSENSPEPFAVVQVDKELFDNPEMRVNLRSVVIHGLNKEHSKSTSLQNVQKELTSDTKLLVSVLESHGTPTRPLFGASGVIEASLIPLHCSDSHVVKVHPEIVRWAVLSGHIPVVQSIGVTSSGQLLNLDINEATGALAPTLSPRKVILTGLECGIQDENEEVIDTVNVPKDLDWCFSMPWCTPELKQKIEYVSELLTSLSPQSSVVMTSPSTLITELFTHHGSGTLFKNTEAIKTYKSLEDIDTARLLRVINLSFGKELKEDYLKSLTEKLDTLYLSEDYNAVAVVTSEVGAQCVPYLDKFAVSKAGQGEGLCQLLWDSIRRDYPKLFWRSRHANNISSWYFKKCEGSWTNGEWIVFWYGVTTHRESSVLTDYALALHDSFATTAEDYPVPET